MENGINILIVDDHQVMIDGIKSLLRNENRFKIVAEATSGEQALEILASDNSIDMLISDISMPGMNGVELVTKVKTNYPDIKVLVLSMYSDYKVTTEILTSEAEGYVLKNTGRKELVEALCRIADNGTYYSHEVLSVMMNEVKKEKIHEKTVQNAITLSDLTAREQEILKLICEEFSSAEIADKLFISKRTVDTHRKNIAEKTGCKTLVSLIKFAIRNELVEI